jgi:4-hydroxy-tetrahydrodipicolinate reductase
MNSEQIRIGLIGYGKMGHEIERAALERGHVVAAIFDLGDAIDGDILKKSGIQVAIDFTQPSAVLPHVWAAAHASIPIVIGTTGWERELDGIKQVVDESHIGCMYASNFSIGVNLFLALVRNAARLTDKAGYDSYVLEAHHKMKKDYPSGTALRVAEAVLRESSSKTEIISELVQGEPIHPKALLISSIRAGNITGTHTVGFEGEDDSIELVHTAKSRKGFANGAVRAAEWIMHRRGFYRFEEFVEDVLGAGSESV